MTAESGLSIWLDIPEGLPCILGNRRSPHIHQAPGWPVIQGPDKGRLQGVPLGNGPSWHAWTAFSGDVSSETTVAALSPSPYFLLLCICGRGTECTAAWLKEDANVGLGTIRVGGCWIMRQFYAATCSSVELEWFSCLTLVARHLEVIYLFSLRTHSQGKSVIMAITIAPWCWEPDCC